MMSLIALITLALAGLTVANDAALPLKINVGFTTSYSGIAISETQVLVPSYSIMSSSNVDVKVRPEGIGNNDSGDIYRQTRIVYKSTDSMDMSSNYAIVTLDRKIAGYTDSAKITKDDVIIPEGEIVTTVRQPTTMSSMYYYWYPLVYMNAKVINDAKCKEMFSSRWTDDFLCVGPADPNAQYPPDNQCGGLSGAALSWNGEIVAISSCDIGCYTDACAYMKISSMREFINQNVQ